MLSELNRRLDVIDGYIDCVNERAEANTPKLIPPFPNRVLRRQEVAEQVEEYLFSPNLKELHESIPENYAGPEFIRQLLESGNREGVPQNSEELARAPVYDLDRVEFINVTAIRNSEKAPQHL
jgi:hypothetical protein